MFGSLTRGKAGDARLLSAQCFAVHIGDMDRLMGDRLRAVALLAGLALIGSFLSVFYAIVNVVGGVGWLVGAVAGAFLLATFAARCLPARSGGLLGGGIFVSGGGLYLLFAGTSRDDILTVEFLTSQFTYLTGASVLQFVRVDLWAVAVAPAPVFLAWYCFVRRQYDLGALIGGVTLGYFVLTGDAGWSTTLAGSLSVLGVLGLGVLERAGGPWHQVERLGLALVVATFASRAARRVGSDTWSRPSSDGGGSQWRSGTVEASLTESDRRVRIFDEVSLSPERRFTVTSTAAAYWHVGSYDRYTGEGWFRAGRPRKYDSLLPHPPGETITVEQTFRIEGQTRVVPAAWKPTRVNGSLAANVRVSSTGGLVTTRPLHADEEYMVVSQVPDVTPERLRRAGTSAPGQIRNRYLQVPESTPSRVERKAREITGHATTAYDAARAVETWLQENKIYSLEGERPQGDVADAFIFEMERGYCVHFATAMIVLLRTLSLPARLAHGYLPGQRLGDDTWVVRALDAHAWTEVYFEGVGWVPFDPTPGEPRAAAERARLAEEVPFPVANATTDDLQPVDTPTVDSPTESQNNSAPLGGATSSTTDDTGGSATSPGAAQGSGGPGLVDQLSTTASRVDRLTLLATVAGVTLGIRQLNLLERGYRAVWLRHQPRTDSPETDMERAFERLEYVLARRHRPRATGETPKQFLAALDPAVDQRAHRVRWLYEQSHYGGQVTRAGADEAIGLVDDLIADRD